MGGPYATWGQPTPLKSAGWLRRANLPRVPQAPRWFEGDQLVASRINCLPRALRACGDRYRSKPFGLADMGARARDTVASRLYDTFVPFMGMTAPPRFGPISQ